MPRKSGLEVFAEMERIKPGQKCIFISGYPAEFLHKKGIGSEGFNVIMKPVVPGDLADKIRSVLAG